ncbi:RHS repeat-associated core domain-containing protein [Pseudomonas kilonensis]|uniref:RHS repeat-associated core domain-containing protein n=1 Tax=Pseudomonas kilonensis TaxID=132476 RepID=A0ABY0YJA2_9PSED|nr:RHS repeat-associated core domain-containing protein [Pseudomonas kilonensis]SED62950.1 RHS repeat-associated core domain-containing protein [Pseudomonas kilonensis]
MTTSSVVHSQAFGFMSYVQGGVDPRTGQYTVSIDLPEVQSNWLCGPAFPLNLTFSPINILDSGFGVGWNLNLSQFTPSNNILALSTGETFKVTGSGSLPDMKEKKLDTFHFENLGGNRYRVLHKSGMVEELQVGGDLTRVALPVSVKSPAGHSLTLAYASFRGGQCLHSISDAQGELLQINRQANDEWVEILVRPYDGPNGTALARYEMKLNASGWVTEIVLPTPDKGSWRFGYGNGPIRNILCLHEIKTPVGGREILTYADTGHPYPGGVVRPNLPRVTRHRSYPDFGQPNADETMVEVQFSYTSHNFLGAGETVSWEDGMDPLYKLQARYEYGSTARLMVGGQVARTVERSYNRFHLLVEEKTKQEHCVKRVSTQYYAEDVPFERQVPQFQFPKEVTTRWELDNDATQYRAEITRSVYNDQGNHIEQVEPNGIRTVYTYYSKNGEDGCPADRFERNLKDTTVYPSSQGEPGAPTLRTRLRYSAHKPLNGSGVDDWLAMDSETLMQVEGANETTLQQTLRTYHELIGNAFLHGRLASQQTLLNGTTSTTLYEYKTLPSVLTGETVLETTETFIGYDDAPDGEVRKTIVSEDSLLHGQPLLTRDDNEVKIRYTYDALTRVVTETVAPDEPEFEATRQYSYLLTALDGQRAEQLVTDVKGVKTRTRVDGLNRPVYAERQDADNLVRAEEFRQTYSASYDVFGDLTEETQYDWRDEQQAALASTYEYDGWGAQRSVTGPDGIKVYEETNPIGSELWQGPIQTAWREGTDTEAKVSGKTVTYLNLLEKPDHVERFETDGTLISRHRYGYDGLGRTVEETDARDATTKYTYDIFDRMVTTVLPGGATVRRSYALHSSEDLPTEISVNGIELGQQVFDGLGRKVESTTGGRKQTFTYDSGQTQPATLTTASNQLINYVYQPQLGEEPSQRSLPGGVTAEYVRDGKNARLVSCKEGGLELSRDYFTTGELKSETRVQGEDTYAMHYQHSRLGLLLSYTDVLEQTQSYTYDKANRLEQTRLGNTLSSDFTFDSLGQLSSVSTLDRVGGQGVTISLHYDGLGREIQRNFDLDGVEQQLTQVYNSVDALIERTLSKGETLLRKETYEYDPRGRLVLYTCEGSEPPVDPYGKVILSQLFRFDALDNLIRVNTTSPEGINVAVYIYDDPKDPTQLRRITNTGVPGYPPEIVLEYDADGHLIRDEENRRLEYDPLGRLVSVSDPSGGGDTGYSYDPLDTLAGLDDGSGKEQRFYQGGELTSLVKGASSSSFLRADGVVLAEHQAGADPKSLLLAGDDKNSVLWEIDRDATQEFVYTPYGHRVDEASVSSHLGYNGERRETQTGWYLLGKGYRAFNPVLMRFHSPDSWSPFGDGGLNAYTYCLGDPISFTDPTGHVIGRLFAPPKIMTPIKVPPQLVKSPVKALNTRVASGTANVSEVSGGALPSTTSQPSRLVVETGYISELPKERRYIARPRNQNFETGSIADLARNRRPPGFIDHSRRKPMPLPDASRSAPDPVPIQPKQVAPIPDVPRTNPNQAKIAALQKRIDKMMNSKRESDISANDLASWRAQILRLS